MAPGTGSPIWAMAEPSGGGGLRRRLAVTLVGLTVVAAAVQGLGYWAAERWVERTSLENQMEQAQTGKTGPDFDSNARAASDTIAREQRLILLLGLGVLAVGLLALWASRRLAARALAPLEALVGEIRALDPEARGARLQVAGDPELRVIAVALNGYMTELDALVERERAFAAAASHELRTPLAVIAGAAELLADRPPDSARPLARITRAVTQARLDLDALLALSRVREAPPMSRLALEQLLPEWAEPHLATPGPRLRWRLSPQQLDAPPGSIHIIFTNLLRNALRAAGADGEVVIELNDDGFSIGDNGPGIPEDELPFVFEPHFRGRDGGTGIGLYVAKALAYRQNWNLTLVANKNAGALASLCFGHQNLRSPQFGDV